MQSKFVGVRELAPMLEVTRATAYRYVEKEGFPEPMAGPFPKKTWRREVIESYIDSM
jgi:predicted DNA-binding transcriptional regulator AlpA